MRRAYEDMKLETGIKGATEWVKCRFSDLEETIYNIDGNWQDIKMFEIRDIPVYRHPDFDYAVSKFVYNLIEKWQIEKDNKEFRKIIFGE